MNYRFDVVKTTQAAAYLVRKYGGKIEYMKLIKLLYLANRESFARYGEPIAPDYFVSMKHGPVMSGLYSELGDPERCSYWSDHFSAPMNYEVAIIKDPDVGDLNRRSLRILDEVDAQWHNVDKWAMVEWMHKNLPEWKDPGDSSRPISVEEILEQVGFSPEEIGKRVIEELAFMKEREALAIGV